MRHGNDGFWRNTPLWAAIPSACLPVLGLPVLLIVLYLAALAARADDPGESATAVAAMIEPPATLGAEGWQPDWRGTPPDELVRLTAALPVLAPSPAMRGLLALLLTGDNWPTGLIPDSEESVALAGQRAMLAARLGFPIPPLGGGDPVPARLRTEALLLTGAVDATCVQTQDAASAAGSDRFWDLLALYCDLRAGRNASAADRFAALAAQGAAEDDGLILEIAATLLGVDGAEAGPDLQYLGWRAGVDLDPLRLAFLDLAAAPPSLTALPGASPARLLAIKHNPRMPDTVRVKAAELAASSGALSPEALAGFYLSLPVQAEELDRLADQGRLPSGPRGRILLAHIIAVSGTPSVIEEALSIGLQLSRAESGSLPVAQALLALADPAADLSDVALDAARAYYAAGALDRAQGWHAVAQDSARDLWSRQALARLWPLAVLAGATPAGDADRLRRWLEAELAVAGEAGAYGAAAVLAAFDALGYDTAPALWNMIPLDDARDVASLPSAALWWRMDAAVTSGATGPALLMALIALGDDGPGRAHPLLLAKTLSALVAIGLDGPARALAREAIWASQI